MPRAYRTGTVYQRKSDGRWIASIPDGRGGRAKYVTGVDRATVEKKLAKLASSTTSPRKPSAETVGAFLDRWVDGERQRGRLRPRTADGYETLIKLHIKPAIGRIRLPELTAEDVDLLVRGMMKKRSAQTARSRGSGTSAGRGRRRPTRAAAASSRRFTSASP